MRLALAPCAVPAGREPLRALMNLSTVFVGNVPFEANENSIREIFKIIGPVRTFW